MFRNVHTYSEIMILWLSQSYPLSLGVVHPVLGLQIGGVGDLLGGVDRRLHVLKEGAKSLDLTIQQYLQRG